MNLYQRLQAVSQEATTLEKTGKTQFGNKATSIGDVENALRPHLTEHGVITRWSYQEDGLVDLSNGKLWMAKLRVTVVNADDSTDCFTDDWTDIGSNPMAATSFARKGYLKALFHLTGDEDEAPAQEMTRKRQAPDTTPAPGNIPFGPDPKPSKKTEQVAAHVPDIEALREEVKAAVVTVAEAENQEARDILQLAIKGAALTTPGGWTHYTVYDLQKIKDWLAKRLDSVPV